MGLYLNGKIEVFTEYESLMKVPDTREGAKKSREGKGFLAEGISYPQTSGFALNAGPCG